ncbi:MAG: CDP-diacylglycerol--serine O-phosphatidyltransferase [Parvibaculaceae bacterium]
MTKSLPPFGSENGQPFSNRRTRAFGTLPIRTVIPNALTVLALCAGLTAIRFGLEGRFEASVAAIIIASIFDALDGRVARFLKGTSKFGAELDSLTDFVNFGVAPVLVLYLWSLSAIGGIGWIAVLGYAVCCALRLARFNVALEDPDKPAWSANYFVGVPAPAGALIVMLPLYLDFIGMPFFRSWPLIVALHCVLVAFLMISQVPTFSGKRMGLRIERDMVLPILVCVGISAAVVLSYPWYAFTFIALGYLCALPLGIMRYRQHKMRSASVTEPDSADIDIG